MIVWVLIGYIGLITFFQVSVIVTRWGSAKERIYSTINIHTAGTLEILHCARMIKLAYIAQCRGEILKTKRKKKKESMSREWSRG